MLKFLKRLNFFAIIYDFTICFIIGFHIFFDFILLRVFIEDSPISLTKDILLLIVLFAALCSFPICFLCGFWLKEKNWLKPKEPESDIPNSGLQKNNRIAAVHEAGHAVMAYLLGAEEICVIMTANPKISTTYSVPLFLYAEDVRKDILICYSGAIAEELLLGKCCSGSYGSTDADFPRAAELLKIYLMLANPSNSKAMVESELADQMVATSKTLYKEATELLRLHINKLEIIAKELETVSELRHEQIRQLLEPASESITPGN